MFQEVNPGRISRARKNPFSCWVIKLRMPNYNLGNRGFSALILGPKNRFSIFSAVSGRKGFKLKAKFLIIDTASVRNSSSSLPFSFQGSLAFIEESKLEMKISKIFFRDSSNL